MPTVISQEALAVFTPYMFQQMPDPFAAAASGVPTLEPTGTHAEIEVARFLALSADVRGCAVLEAGRVLASSGDPLRWGDAAVALLDAADRAASGAAEHAHVATEDGEVFAARTGDWAIVAVTERFTLASLVLADMRAVLRAMTCGLGVNGGRADGQAA